MAIQYLATNRKVGDGTTQVWDFSFAGARPDANNGTEPYLDTDDIRVATVEITSEGDEIRDPIQFELGPGPSQVTINPALESGQDFVIFRATDSEVPVADFVDFASISEQDLDNGFRQTLYVVQELQDRVADANANSVNAIGIANVASALAEGAEQDSTAALALATTANSNANQANTNAASALSAADGAVTAANTANSTANTALTNANQAQSAVAGIVSTANTANSNAATALSTANAASTAASGATSTANTALSVANTASVAAQEALGTANTAIALADDADGKADQALEAAGLIVDFQAQLDQIEATVADLTGVEAGAITLNADNLSELADFAEARTNLEVYSKSEVDTTTNALAARLTTEEQNTGWIWDEFDTLEAAALAKADKTTTVSSGVGLVGGGDLSENRVISLGLPSTLAGNTSNSTTGTTHSHAIDATASRTDSTPGRILLASGMNTHRTSSDHDGRYYTKTQIDDRHTLDSGWLRTDPTKILRFCVFKSSTQQVVGGDKITWSTVLYDDSTFFFYTPTQYSRTLHRFTAPVSGLYEFRAQLTRNPTSSSAYADPVDGRFAVNGTILNTTGPACHVQSKVNNYSGAALDNVQLNYIQANLWGQIILNAGDYVEVFHAASSPGSEVFGSTSGRHTWFSGRLL